MYDYFLFSSNKKRKQEKKEREREKNRKNVCVRKQKNGKKTPLCI